MEANLVKYYSLLLRSSSSQERLRTLSDYSALYLSLAELQEAWLGGRGETCHQDCQARHLLSLRLMADWLGSIDQRLASSMLECLHCLFPDCCFTS